MSNDSNTSTTKIPYNTEGMNADNVVTPGYIAPERAELMLNQNNKDDQDEEKKILLDSKQDVFIFLRRNLEFCLIQHYAEWEPVISGRGGSWGDCCDREPGKLDHPPPAP